MLVKVDKHTTGDHSELELNTVPTVTESLQSSADPPSRVMRREFRTFSAALYVMRGQPNRGENEVVV
jgi:hypothetical protein